MSRLKTPPEKRAAARQRDHRTEMEAPHAFRKNWPKKKARINRNRRRAASAAVRSVVLGAEPDGLLVPRRLRGEHIRKMGVGSLESAVAAKQRRTRTGFLPRYIRPRADPGRHATAFRGFLASLVEGRTGVSLDRARHFRWLLDAKLPNNHQVLYQQIWLRRFFAGEPQWEARVRTWCRQLEAGVVGRRRRTRR